MTSTRKVAARIVCAIRAYHRATSAEWILRLERPATVAAATSR
jgi:hypothetical protein